MFPFPLCALPPLSVPALPCCSVCIGYRYYRKWLSPTVALFYARFSIHYQCVYAASFCCITPPLSFPLDGLTITLDRPVPIKFVHVCTNITGNPSFSCGPGVSPCCLLFIIFEVALLLPPAIILDCRRSLSSCSLLPREWKSMYFYASLNDVCLGIRPRLCPQRQALSTLLITRGFRIFTAS